nr:hypothetical protein TetV2_00539 [Oceanusvirus sp.]
MFGTTPTLFSDRTFEYRVPQPQQTHQQPQQTHQQTQTQPQYTAHRGGTAAAPRQRTRDEEPSTTTYSYTTNYNYGPGSVTLDIETLELLMERHTKRVIEGVLAALEEDSNNANMNGAAVN